MPGTKRCWFVVLLPVLLAGFFSPDLYWKLRGWTHGESFYDGRPTSYWAAEMDRWDVGST